MKKVNSLHVCNLVEDLFSLEKVSRFWFRLSSHEFFLLFSLQFIRVEMSVRSPETSSVLRQSLLLLLRCCTHLCWCCRPFTWNHTGKKVWNKLDCADRLRCFWRSVLSFLVTLFFLYIQIHLMWRATFQVSVLELYVVKLVRTVQLLSFPSLKDLVAVWCSSGLFVSMCLFHKLWPNIWYNFIYNRGVLWNVII